jgi:phosphoserine phosphatase RsbU/P
MTIQPMFVDTDHTPAPRFGQFAHPDLPFVVRAYSRPTEEFTGDFFFSFAVGDALWFGLGDFAGHGLRATIFMAMLQEVLEGAIRSCSSADPAEIVAELDRTLRAEVPYNRFATLVVGRSRAGGEVQLVNAGHCPPIFLTRGRIELIGSHGPVVGILPGARWQQQTIRMSKGDRLALYSDGIVEAANERGDEFGTASVVSFLSRMAEETPLESILDAAAEFAGGELTDDATIFLLEHH